MGRKEENAQDTFSNFHGNWCGPGWTAGKFKNAEDMTFEDLTVPAIDAFDQVCKDHDIFLAKYPERADEAHQRFTEGVQALWDDPDTTYTERIKGLLAAKLVHSFGPGPSDRKYYIICYEQQRSKNAATMAGTSGEISGAVFTQETN
jgi:hypothetical protein